MKVVCSICRDLIDENDAIKMNHVEIKLKTQEIYDTPFVSYVNDEYARYGQICLSCHSRRYGDENVNGTQQWEDTQNDNNS